ncbi:hypothetical protein TB2_043815 [Malus domestica]|uniref:Uncharacterized protein n=1 Tax=Malus domestica TaxID=3750 RepID=A0A498J5X2_MALDO|nr:hypothetical protein DVH24_006835 [Malus domestica]
MVKPIFINTYGTKRLETSKVKQLPSPKKWRKPENGWLKCNFDGFGTIAAWWEASGGGERRERGVRGCLGEKIERRVHGCLGEEI